MSVMREVSSRHYAFVLFVLTCLFAFRVIAQLLQGWSPVSFLPPYEAWHSGALPYSLLVSVQGAILIVCLRIVWGLWKGSLTPSKQKGTILFGLGSLYLLAMCVRLFVGLAIAPNHYWWGATVPTLFHLVLASFVILYSRFHLNFSQLELSKNRNNPT